MLFNLLLQIEYPLIIHLSNSQIAKEQSIYSLVISSKHN